MAAHAAPTAQSNPPAIPLTSNATEDLWSEAVKLLHPDDNEQIRLQTADKLTVLSEVLTAAKEKSEQCKDGQWKYNKSDGTVIVLRDVFDKMIKWLKSCKRLEIL